MVASQNGHVEVVNMLLQHGARVDLQNKVYEQCRAFKRVESRFLHILVIISVILHAIHTKDISIFTN